MNQLSIMIALLAALAIGNAMSSGVDSGPQSRSGDRITQNQASKIEPPKPQAGGGEGGWPAF